MGTNFYIKGHRDVDDPKYHIGKRSARGLYCWNCEITLDGKDKCPRCGSLAKKENIESSSTGRELGFNKNIPQKKKGVSSCSSFTWARLLTSKIKYIEDEYGQIYTREEFEKVLEECPLQFEALGEWFS